MSSSLMEKHDQGAGILEAEQKKPPKRLKLNIITTKNFMFRIRSGHNFYTIRLAEESVLPHNDQLDGIIALDEETDKLYREKLEANGFIIGNSKLPMDDPRVLRLVLEEMAMAALLLGKG